MCAAAIGLVFVLGPASPASAHGAASDDAPASNYRSRVTDHPPLDGVQLRVIEAGSRVELVNRSDEEVVVEGYDGEPYLRVGPDGVLENSNSPATYLNQDRDGAVAPPAGVGEGPPRWRRISGERSVRFHDHRAHWMGGDPPLVRERPDERHMISQWEVPLRVGDRTVKVAGVLEWVPGPSPLGWVGFAAAIGAALLALVLRRRVLTAIVAVFAITTAAAVLFAVGAWQASSESSFGKLPMLTLPVLVATLLAGALSLARARRSDALVLAAGAACTAALTTALTSGDWLVRSQLPTALPAQLGRAAVASVLGAGAGLAIGALGVIAAPLLARSSSGGSDRRAERTSPVAEPAAATAADNEAADDEKVTAGRRSDPPDTNRPPPVDAPPEGAGHPAAHGVELGRFRTRILVAAGATVAAVLTISQLTGGDAEQPTSPGDVAAALGQICAAVGSAPSDSGVALRAAFEGPAHDTLHTFAADVEAKDRAAAGTLLRAKQEIEATIATPGDVPDPGPELVVAIADGFDVLGDPAPQPCMEDDT